MAGWHGIVEIRPDMNKQYELLPYNHISFCFGEILSYNSFVKMILNMAKLAKLEPVISDLAHETLTLTTYCCHAILVSEF